MFNQKEFIAAYNNEYREQFNPVLLLSILKKLYYLHKEINSLQ